MKDKIFNSLQLIGGVLLSIGYMPQIIQILKTGLVRDLNLTMNIMVMIGILMFEAYAIWLVRAKKSGHAFLITNSLSVLFSTTMVVLILIYR